MTIEEKLSAMHLQLPEPSKKGKLRPAIRIGNIVRTSGQTSPQTGRGDVPNGLENAGKFSNLTSALLRRGFSEADVRKILIGNVGRVYRQVLDQA